jgi:hypothetical protein
MIKAAIGFIAILWTGVASAQEPPLIRLPKAATAGMLAFKKGGLAETGKEMHLGGWLVLNGARFQNAEFPVLANALRENYARQGRVFNDAEFTQLPAQPSLTNPAGQIVRGVAICPSPVICGDMTGSLMPFNLDASL